MYDCYHNLIYLMSSLTCKILAIYVYIKCYSALIICVSRTKMCIVNKKHWLIFYCCTIRSKISSSYRFGEVLQHLLICLVLKAFGPEVISKVIFSWHMLAATVYAASPEEPPRLVTPYNRPEVFRTLPKQDPNGI